MSQFKCQVQVKGDTSDYIDGVLSFEENIVKIISEARGTYELPYSVFGQSVILDTDTDNLCSVATRSNVTINGKVYISDIVIKVKNAVLFSEHLESLNYTVMRRSGYSI